jgi:hypothetical protein
MLCGSRFGLGTRKRKGEVGAAGPAGGAGKRRRRGAVSAEGAMGAACPGAPLFDAQQTDRQQDPARRRAVIRVAGYGYRYSNRIHI